MRSQIETSVSSLSYDNIIRSLNNLETNGFIKCLDVQISDNISNINRAIIFPTRKDCSKNILAIDGFEVLNEITLPSGVVWKVRFSLINDAVFTVLLWITRLLGAFACLSVFHFLKIRSKKIAYERSLEIQANNRIKDVSIKLAHDIRSPLSVINLISSKLTFENEEIKSLLDGSLIRLNSIANSLLLTDKSQIYDLDQLSLMNIKNIISQLCREKSIEFNNLINITLDIKLDSNEYVSVNRVELERILSNIINNSVESRRNSVCKIEILAFEDQNGIRIQITDDGLGIDSSVIKQLGNKKITTKNNGNGIGIFAASKYLNSVGGKIVFKSKVNTGTTISIFLKFAPKQSS